MNAVICLVLSLIGVTAAVFLIHYLLEYLDALNVNERIDNANQDVRAGKRIKPSTPLPNLKQNRRLFGK